MKFQVGDVVITRIGMYGVVLSVDAKYEYNEKIQPIHAQFYDKEVEFNEYFFEDGKYVIDDNSIWDIRKATKLDRVLK